MFPNLNIPAAAARISMTATAYAPNRAPNWWVVGRAVRFAPSLEAGLALIGAQTDTAEALQEAAKRHGWPFATWRTTRVTSAFQLPEENLGRFSPGGEFVVAVVRIEGNRHRRGEHAVYFGELTNGFMRQDHAMARCAELDRLGLSTDLWTTLPTTL